MRWLPPGFLRCPPNEAVLSWLEGKSAHSDPAEALRLPMARVADRVARGARPAGYVGPAWVFLPLYGPGGFAAELAALAREAHAFAADPGPA